MTIDVSWYDDDQTIVYYTFADPWGWNELHPQVERALEMETGVTYRVDVIVDMTQTMQVPPNVISNLQRIANKQPENLGLSVFIVKSRFYNTLFNIIARLSQIVRYHYRMCATLDEAVAIIQDDRNKQPPH